MWIILYNALDDFGIREINDVTRTGSPETLLPQHAQIEDKKRKVMNEALHGALRIAGLVRRLRPHCNRKWLMHCPLYRVFPLALQAGVLATNGYLVGGSFSAIRDARRMLC